MEWSQWETMQKDAHFSPPHPVSPLSRLKHNIALYCSQLSLSYIEYTNRTYPHYSQNDGVMMKRNPCRGSSLICFSAFWKCLYKADVHTLSYWNEFPFVHPRKSTTEDPSFPESLSDILELDAWKLKHICKYKNTGSFRQIYIHDYVSWISITK